MIMERVQGEILADYLFEKVTIEERKPIMTRFIKEMVSLHMLEWRSLFPRTDRAHRDISSNPYFFVERVLQRPKAMINKYHIDELRPLIDWLDTDKQKCEIPVLLHGDYHMNNIILTPKGDLVVIDWADIKVGDYRYDLGFSIVTTSSAGSDVTETFTKLYESLSGKQVKNISYFMVLSSLGNILRCYSAIINPEITNENETTKNMFLVEYYNYTKYLVTMVERSTGIHLTTIQNELN
jgi:aminoglycoside phosphotransferase (APT) family kinase protein